MWGFLSIKRCGGLTFFILKKKYRGREETGIIKKAGAELSVPGLYQPTMIAHHKQSEGDPPSPQS